jgi:catecholate siderophore receptor
MSGRRSKQLRKKLSLGALVAYSAFGMTRLAHAESTPPGAQPPMNAAMKVAELPMRRFEIAAGPLDVTLRAFETFSGVKLKVAFPAEVLIAFQSAGANGVMTDADALAHILENTGIEATFSGRRAATLTLPAMSESIEVKAKGEALASLKFTRPILDTPRTLSVIPDEVMHSQGATTLRDVLRNTPGITFQAGEGGGGLPGDTFSMRGFSAGNDITVDGVREAGAYSRDAFNLEQVEVLKGPAGAVAGRGATGGSINLVSKMPKADPFARVSTGMGNAGYTRATLDANAPLHSIEGTALRVNAMYGASRVPNRDVVENSSWGVAPSLSLGIGKPTRFTVAYTHLAQDNVPDYGLPWAALDAGADQSNFYGLQGYDYETITSDTATATAERDLSSRWTLRNISRWTANERDSAITSPRPPNRQLQQRFMEHGQLANQTSVAGSFHIGAIQHDFAGGIEIARERTETRRQSQTANQPQTDLLDPDPSQHPFGPMPTNLGNPEETTLGLLGVYAFDTVRLGSRWEVSAGLRWDSVDADYALTNRATNAVTRLGRDDRMTSWNAGVVYKPRANGSIYAGAGTSFNPSVEAAATGAGLSDTPSAANNINLAPEKTQNLELGTKWELAGGRAAATAAVFRTIKTNARTRNATSDPFVLDGEQRVEGVELGLSGRIRDNWTILGGYSFLHSEFAASANPLEEGAALAFTPEHSFNVWTDARVASKVSLGAGAQYMDAVFRNATNTAEVPGYWLMNAMAAYDVTAALTLRLNVNNLTDERYVDRAGGGHYIPGAGRSVILSAEIDF